ncbi:unnamed protein product [Wickerhamomyces anomalus]
MLKNIKTSSTLRAVSLSPKRAFSQYKPTRNEHHDHDHHHGETLNEEEKLSSSYIYGFIATGAVVAYWAINQSYAKSHNGESLTSKILTPVKQKEELIEDMKVYNEKLKKSSDLRDAMSIPAPNKLFHEFTSMQVIPSGSPSNYVPGSQLDLDNIGPRRQKKSIFD